MAKPIQSKKKKPIQSKKKDPTTRISMVVFDITYDAKESKIPFETAMQEIFGFSQPVKLQAVEKTRTRYVAGNYKRDGKTTWVGQFEMLRAAHESTFHVEPGVGNVLSMATKQVITSENRSSFAFSPGSSVLVYRDRASLPYTRLETFLRAALAQEKKPYVITMRPRHNDATLREAIKSYDSIRSISVTYRHSQSPGNPFVDGLITELGANKVTEKVDALPGEWLNTNGILNGKKSILGRVVDHLTKNFKNGTWTLDGDVGGETIKIRSRKQVQRKTEEANDNAPGILRKLVDYVLSL